MTWNKGKLLYEGKAKKIFEVVGHPEFVWMEFKDDLTAFNAQKRGSFAGKGQINKSIAELIFCRLAATGIATHWKESLSKTEWLTERVEILPLEVVVRNRLAGSTAKKFMMPEGTALEHPLVEFFYKKDEWNDPFVSDEQALFLKAARHQSELEELKKKALQINAAMTPWFRDAGFELIDFKVEFGRDAKGQIVLADEISPDSCRIWDMKNNEKFDKDRFRLDLGNVEESYREVLRRLESVMRR